jgi:GTP-binding protein EngB required for normal cell division
MGRPRWAAPAVLAAALACPILNSQEAARETSDIRLPDGKSQQEEILKADHQKSLKDAAELVELAEQLKAELERNDRHVLSISSLKKTEQIEKLAKRIRGRLRRY